jgi:hypothetical protein
VVRAEQECCLSGVAMNSPGAFADLAAQRACWHPVAFAGDVGDRPVHADLLGEPLVVWRGGHVLRYEIVRPEAPNSEDFPVFGNEQAGPPIGSSAE